MYKIFKSIQIRWKRWQTNQDIWWLTRQITQHADLKQAGEPVIFFNASTRLIGMSQNAAFALLAAAGLQLAGIPVVYFTCQAGMLRCVLGTRLDDLQAKPPCQACMQQSRWLFAHAPAVSFRYAEDARLKSTLAGLDLAALSEFTFHNQPLGELVLPSMRWTLRRHHLPDDESTRELFRDYILSAWRISQEFTALLDQVTPRAVVLFNGMFFPEAVARWAALQRGVRVITHEVGLQPLTAFFTYGQATAYPLDVPQDFQLTETQNARLDAYLEQRFQGKFSMAGVRFWESMQGLGDELLQKIAQFKQVVPVFTHVIFDTSQPHSNVVFPHMFSWLEMVQEIARQHRETLFVLRAHPDENRLWKESRESVAQWVQQNWIEAEPNIVFVEADQPLSSYELIQRAKFVMVYNSTIGLEASLMGAAVLCAGRARFTQLPTVFFPQTAQAFQELAERFIDADSIEVPQEFVRNARRFLFYQLFQSSLPFGAFLQPDGIWTGFVRLRRFDWQALTAQKSTAHAVLLKGLSEGVEFILPLAEETPAGPARV